MASKLIQEALQGPAAPELYEGPLKEEKRRPGPRERGLRPERNLVQIDEPELDADDAYAMLVERTKKPPAHVLVLAAPPGVGKTSIGVAMAERAAAAGQRVLYLGPRHDFFKDVMQIARHGDWWYEWLPRQVGDAERGKRETCRYEPQMTMWLNRGYKAMDFCGNPRICGFDYVAHHCPYHAQARMCMEPPNQETAPGFPNGQPIVFGQHQHLTGHPLMEHAHLIIGDENPLQAMLRHWIIPGRHVMPQGMDISDPFTEIVHRLTGIVERETKAEGPDILNLLGGAERVAAASADWHARIAAAGGLGAEELIAPRLRGADDVEAAPYGHLFALAWHLHREAAAALTQRPYPPRVAIAGGKLHLLLRRSIDARVMGKTIVWLDATANERIYQEIFTPLPVEVVAPKIRLQGRIFQVWPRANGKGSLIEEGKTNSKADQLQQQVRRLVAKYGYQRPAIITFESLKEIFVEEVSQAGHFYAARGTNRFEGCDCLIVAGTPQPDLQSIHATARMLFQDRMDAFNLEWSDRDRVYRYVDAGGNCYAYPTSGFWHDADLQALLWQYREAEIIQAAHRVRPARARVDVWLLTNIPIDELPPTELLDIKTIFDAPPSVDPYRWPKLIALADKHYEEDMPLTAGDLVREIGIDDHTARKWIDLLVAQQPDRWMRPPPDYVIPRRSRGRPPRTIVPIASNIRNDI